MPPASAANWSATPDRGRGSAPGQGCSAGQCIMLFYAPQDHQRYFALPRRRIAPTWNSHRFPVMSGSRGPAAGIPLNLIPKEVAVSRRTVFTAGFAALTLVLGLAASLYAQGPGGASQSRRAVRRARRSWLLARFPCRAGSPTLPALR